MILQNQFSLLKNFVLVQQIPVFTIRIFGYLNVFVVLLNLAQAEVP